MPTPFDATTKWLVDLGPADWLALIGMEGAEGEPFEPEVVDGDVATVTADADRVIRVNAPAPALVDLEFVSGHHGNEVADGLLFYSTLLTRKYRLPVRSAAILLRREADSPLLTGYVQRHHANGQVYMSFAYTVVRVWQIDVESVLSGGIGTLPLAPVTAVSVDGVPAVVRRMEDRIAAEAAPDVARDLWAATYVLMGLRYSEPVAQNVLRGVRQMKDSVTYQAILREGRTAGIAIGEIEGERRVLLRQGTSRFGEPSPEVLAALYAINSPERLLDLADRVLQVDSWDQLLPRPSAD